MKIEFRNVTYRYHYDNMDVLSGASFTLDEGVNTILCDIQSGKGTICKLILGNLAPTSGRVLLDGQDACNLPQKQLSALYLTDKPTFFVGRSVQYNLEYPCRVRKTLKQNGDKIAELAQQFGLADLMRNKVKTLTPPQKLALSVARGLTVARQLVLLDGFFDDTNVTDDPQLGFPRVLDNFPCTKVVLTTNPALAIGHTVVLDGGACVYEGDGKLAQEVVSNLGWLADKI